MSGAILQYEQILKQLTEEFNKQNQRCDYWEQEANKHKIQIQVLQQQLAL